MEEETEGGAEEERRKAGSSDASRRITSFSVRVPAALSNLITTFLLMTGRCVLVFLCRTEGVLPL